jgi:hypothetical protein
MKKLLFGFGIPGALFLSFYMFLQNRPAYGVAALILAVILIAIAVPKLKRNSAANNESYRRLADKLGADSKWSQRLAGVYRNRQVEIISGKHYRKFFCVLNVPCGQNLRGLSFRIEPRWPKEWAQFNDETFKSAVLTEERQRILKEKFGSPNAGVLILEDSMVSYAEGDWLVGPEKIDRFNLMLDIACDMAELVEGFSETQSSRDSSQTAGAFVQARTTAG